MTIQDGVKKIVVSGMRSTIVMEEGKVLSEEKIRDALGERRLKFVSMELVARPAPKAIFFMKVAGVT